MSEHESTTHGHVQITRYKVDGVEKRTGYVGTIEPEHDEGWLSWIIFLRADNSGTLYTSRKADGTVVGEGFELPAPARPRQQLEADVLEVGELPPRVTVNISRLEVNIDARGSQNKLDGSHGFEADAGADARGADAAGTAAG